VRVNFGIGFIHRLGGDGMILDRSLLSACGACLSLWCGSIVLLSPAWGAEIPENSGVVTADLEIVSGRDDASAASPRLQKETEKLFGRGENPSALLRIGATKSSNDGNVGKGTSSSKVRNQAIEQLPLRQMTNEHREKVSRVVKEAGFYRRLPTVVFPAESECYGYFLDYPESAVSLWRAMGISEMKLTPSTPNVYVGDVGDGTFGTLEVLYRDSETVLVHCDGQYKSPFLKQPIKSQSVLILKTNYFRETDNRVYVTHRADLFVTFPSQTVETVARVLAPLTAPIADRSFVEVSMFLKMMSLAMERRPDWVEEMAARMDGIPEDRKTKLMQVTGQIHSRIETQVSLSDHREGIPASSRGSVAGPVSAAKQSTDLPLHPE